MIANLRWIAAFAAGLSFFGCSSDDGAADNGTAPKISDLTVTPTEIEVGKQAALSGTITIDDPEGDVAQVGVDATVPGGQKQSFPKTAAQGASGVKQGQIGIALAIVPPAAGAYDLSFFVVDGKGNESNRLSVTITVK
jgi:hypothetical protein